MNGTTLLIHYSERETTPEKLDAYAKSLGLSTEQLIKRFIAEGLSQADQSEQVTIPGNSLEDFFIKNGVLKENT